MKRLILAAGFFVVLTESANAQGTAGAAFMVTIQPAAEYLYTEPGGSTFGVLLSGGAHP